jgi:hypothetical protein
VLNLLAQITVLVAMANLEPKLLISTIFICHVQLTSSSTSITFFSMMGAGEVLGFFFKGLPSIL